MPEKEKPANNDKLDDKEHFENLERIRKEPPEEGPDGRLRPKSTKG